MWSSVTFAPLLSTALVFPPTNAELLEYMNHLGDNAIMDQSSITPNTGTYTLEITASGDTIDLDVSGPSSGTASYASATDYSFGQAGIWQPDPSSGLTVMPVASARLLPAASGLRGTGPDYSNHRDRRVLGNRG